MGSTTATASVSVTVLPPPVARPIVEPKSFAERVDTELADVYFDFDKSDIRADARTVLTEHADALRSILSDSPDGIIVVEGYCDERGSAEYNLALDDRRTESTNAFLAALGVETSRLKPIS